MAEPIEAAEDVKQEPKPPVINPNVPLNRQIDRMLEAVPEKKDETDDKPKDKPDEDAKDTKTPDKTDPDSSAESKDDPDPAGDEDEEDDTPAPKLEDLPPVAKYVLERLPDIEAYGHIEGKADKVYKVKRLEDLPSDFEFAGGRRAEMAFMAAHNANELNARDLLKQYQSEQQQRDYQTLKDQEAKDVQADLKQLQKEGLLPKFKYPETDSRFNDDPAVKEANEIYALYEKVNNGYLQRKLNYRISYRDAADKYYAAQTRAEKNKPADDKKVEPKNTEREDVARKVGAPSGGGTDIPKRMPAGSTTRDIVRLYEQGRI